MPRDINDVYVLPAGNPVIPDTVIDTDWANNTMNDIAQALTDSLDKSDPAQARTTLGLGTMATQDSDAVSITGGSINISSLQVGSLNGGQLAGMRNKIINGKMEIAQRGTSFTISNGYTIDRWGIVLVGGGAISTSQQLDTPSNNEFRASLRATVNTPDTSIAASDLGFLIQKVEGYNARDLIGKSFTLSFWVRSPKSGTHCVAFRNATPDRSYVLEYTVNVANTWEYKTVTVAGGLITAGTWDWTNGIGLNVIFTLAAGSNFHTTAGQWQTGNFLATSNQVNCLDAAGNVFAITGVQLEVGPVATPFEHRPIGVEANLCLRYYCKTFPMSTPPANGAGRAGTLAAATYPLSMFAFANWRFPAPMRATPSISTFSYVGSTGGWIDGGAISGSPPGVFDVSESSASIFMNSGSSFSGTTNIFYIHAVADAEL